MINNLFHFVTGLLIIALFPIWGMLFVLALIISLPYALGKSFNSIDGSKVEDNLFFGLLKDK
jgi:hypothetical protein